MTRIIELANQLADGLITAKEFRSSMMAQLSMLNDEGTKLLCNLILRKKP